MFEAHVNVREVAGHAFEVCGGASEAHNPGQRMTPSSLVPDEELEIKKLDCEVDGR